MFSESCMHAKLLIKVRFWLAGKSCLARSISSSYAHSTIDSREARGSRQRKSTKARFQKYLYSTRHIKFLDICMEH